MPTWDFQCPMCAGIAEHAFDNWHHMLATVDDEHEPRCPLCDLQMKRLASAPNFSIKGFNAQNGYSG